MFSKWENIYSVPLSIVLYPSLRNLPGIGDLISEPRRRHMTLYKMHEALGDQFG